MKKSILNLSILCFLTAISAGKTFGQMAQSDSSNLHNSINQATADFYIAIGQQARLYNGHEYISYDRTIKGNALYPLDAQTWATGNVTYDGYNYKGVPLMYDIYKDVVVVLLYNHFTMYKLLDDRVKDFSFSGHQFVRVTADTLVNDKSGITTGFYDELYGGNKVQVVAKRTKTIQNSTNITANLETYFIASNDYYLRKGNTWYKVGSQGSFLNALKDKKPALQQYMKENNIKFKGNNEAAMASLAAYYDRL